jgi:hypothetical protein
VKTYDFTLILHDVSASDELADRLHENNCDDATLSSQAGVVYLQFSRWSESRAEAVTSAIQNVKRCGITATLSEAKS